MFARRAEEVTRWAAICACCGRMASEPMRMLRAACQANLLAWTASGRPYEGPCARLSDERPQGSGQGWQRVSYGRWSSMSTRLFCLALIACFAFPASAFAAAGDPVLDNEEKALCRAINSYRAQNGVPALKVSVALTKASRWMSADMARKNYFSHTDSLGRSFSQRMTAFGYSGAAARREHRRRPGGRRATFNRWKSSSAHRAEHAEHDLQGHRHRPRLDRQLDDRLHWTRTSAASPIARSPADHAA